MCEVDGANFVVGLRVGEEEVEWEEGVCVGGIEGNVGDGSGTGVDINLLADFGGKLKESEGLESH